MSIIYSYPGSTPTAEDLLIGTDVSNENTTVSYTMGQVAALVGQIASAGTVTSVQLATDAFLTATGGPITGPAPGTITIGLAQNGGTPSATTFYRGDGQWAIPTTNSGVSISSDGAELTNSVTSINFSGDGVFASSQGGVVDVQIQGPQNVVEKITTGVGVSVTPTTGVGTVQLINTGVTSIVEGVGISISPTGGTGAVTITANNTNVGSVVSVSAGVGLKLQGTGVSTVNPTLAVDLVGNNNYIEVSEAATVADPLDYIAFNHLGGNTAGDVKTTTFESIPVTALTAVKTYIDANSGGGTNGDAITHTFDKSASGFSGTVPIANQIVTLTELEYTNLGTKDPNFLYLTIANPATPPVTETVTLALDVTGVGPAALLGPSGFTVTGAQNGDTKGPGLIGTPYTFNSGATVNASYYFSTAVSVNQPTRNFIAGVTSVTNTMTATIAQRVANTVTVTLAANGSLGSNTAGGEGTIWNWTRDGGGSLPGDTQADIGSLNYSFTLIAKIIDQNLYQWNSPFTNASPPTVTEAGTATVDQTVTGSVDATYEAISSTSTITTNFTITGTPAGFNNSKITVLNTAGANAVSGNVPSQTIAATAGTSITLNSATPTLNDIAYSFVGTPTATVVTPTQTIGSAFTVNVVAEVQAATTTSQYGIKTTNVTGLILGTNATLTATCNVNGTSFSFTNEENPTQTNIPVGATVTWSATLVAIAPSVLTITPATFNPAQATLTAVAAAGSNVRQTTTSENAVTVIYPLQPVSMTINQYQQPPGDPPVPCDNQSNIVTRFYGTSSGGAPSSPNGPVGGEFIFTANNGTNITIGVSGSSGQFTDGSILYNVAASGQLLNTSTC
jgi:hypothetical protein